VGKEMDTGVLWVAHQAQEEGRLRRRFEVEAPHWIAGPPAAGPVEVKLRHGPQTTRCTLGPLEGGRVRVELEQPDPGVAPGQHAVFYQGEVCLGGAVIA
jgi:tRNA-specific 2-thiouridylase